MSGADEQAEVPARNEPSPEGARKRSEPSSTVTEDDVKAALRSWVQQRSGTVVDNDTPLLAERILTSLQVMDLLLYLEELRQDGIDPRALKPGVFRDIDTIYATFFGAGS